MRNDGYDRVYACQNRAGNDSVWLPPSLLSYTAISEMELVNTSLKLAQTCVDMGLVAGGSIMACCVDMGLVAGSIIAWLC